MTAACTFVGDLLEPLINYMDIAGILFLVLTVFFALRLALWRRGQGPAQRDSPGAGTFERLQQILG